LNLRNDFVAMMPKEKMLMGCTAKAELFALAKVGAGQ
jgi:hypothetical protein